VTVARNDGVNYVRGEPKPWATVFEPHQGFRVSICVWIADDVNQRVPIQAVVVGKRYVHTWQGA
jgi:hypothetical protein